MCQSNCCSTFWAVLIVLAHISALSSPWYMWLSRANVDCQTRTLMTWSHIHVSSYDSGFSCDSDQLDTVNWRDICALAKRFSGDGDEKCNSMIRTMDTAVAFTALSFICSIVVIVYAFRHACCQNRPGGGTVSPSPVARGFMWTGFACSLIAIVSFAAQFPHAWKKLFGDCEQWKYETIGMIPPSCPANSLIGWNRYEEWDANHGSNTGNYGERDSVAQKAGKATPMVWVPVAFWVAVWICMCYLFALCTWSSQRQSADRADTQTHIVAQQQQPPSVYNLQQPQQFVQQQQPHPQPVMMQQIEGQPQRSLYPQAVHI